MDEVWKPIARLPGYQVSNLGRFIGPDGKERKLQSHGSGYLNLVITLPAHRLVCEAFHGESPFPGAQALHGPDHTKTNISADNLRWGTNQENVTDTIDSGRANFLKGEEHGRALLTWDIVRSARARSEAGESIKALWRELGESLGVTYPAFYKAVKGITWKEEETCES